MITDNVLKIKACMEEACRKAGRDPSTVTLVGVTKFAPLEAIEEAIKAGITDIAENRVQEAVTKFPVLAQKFGHLRCHLIGHLQTNKVKNAIAVCGMVQSVDSLKLAQEIQKQAVKADKTVDILVQFNTAREEQKSGASPEEALTLTEAITGLGNVRIRGVMCMAPYTDDQGIIRKTFSDLRGIRDRLKQYFGGHAHVAMDILSMGMSGDYAIAIEEGSTMVRVGSAIFNEKN